MQKICSRPGCCCPNSALSYRVAKIPGAEYCSRECMDAVFEQQGKKMKVPATDFGDAGVVRRHCDHCGALCSPLCWPGRLGSPWEGQEYCTNRCKRAAEAKGEPNVTDSTEANATAAATSPIVAGAPAPKKTAKKAPAKKAVKKSAAPAKKSAAPKKAASNGSGKFSNDAVITVKKEDHEHKGKRGTCMDLMKTGLTVGKYRENMAKKGLDGWYVRWALVTATEDGRISVK